VARREIAAVRVLHLVKTAVGAPWAWRQIRELVGAGVDVVVAVPGGGPMAERYRQVGARVHELELDLPLRNPLGLVARVRRLRHLVERERPDVVHSHFVGTTLTMRLALGRRAHPPRVFQVPGPLHLEHALFRRLELSTATAADHWIVTCKRTRELYLAAGVNGSRLHLSYYGVDLDACRRPAGGVLREEIGVPSPIPIAGMVAYMYAPRRYLGQRRGIKGHEDFIDAVAILAGTKPELRAVVVGAAWAGAWRYEAQVREYGRRRCGDRLVFLGYRDDVPRIYADLDVAVHPSHSENVGGAGESALAEVPTVATTVGGFPDIIEPGVSGLLVPPRDPAALAAAIGRLLDDPRGARAMAAEARRRAERMLDVRRTAAEVATIYGQILGGARSGRGAAP
jgi:glycosyltransferase involved in cell wall biosynthesis